MCVGGVTRSNGNPVVEVYGKHALNDPEVQGGILSLSLLHDDGSYIGYYEVQTRALKEHLHIRTGCHCNPGACRKYLRQPADIVERVMSFKRTCSDANDLLDGLPLGASGRGGRSLRVVRVSLGYLTTYNDIYALVEFVKGYIDYSSVSDKHAPKQHIN